MAAACALERRAWHTRLPAARALCGRTDDGNGGDGDGAPLRPRHVAMLAALLLPGSATGRGGARPTGGDGLDPGGDEDCGLTLEQLLSSYGLLPRGGGDACSDAELDAAPASAGGACGGAGGDGGVGWDGGVRGVISAADLATACSAGPRARGALDQIAQIARSERDLARNLVALDASLRAARLRLSGGRVSGCLLLFNLGDLSSDLEGRRSKVLDRAGRATGAPGVAAKLERVGRLRAGLAACVRVSRLPGNGWRVGKT